MNGRRALSPPPPSFCLCGKLVSCLFNSVLRSKDDRMDKKNCMNESDLRSDVHYLGSSENKA